MNSAEITVATWNTAWATSVGQHPPLVRERLAETAADIFVVTEGHRGLLPNGGYVVGAGDDWGYDDKPHHRKMLLHSRLPLSDVDRLTTGGGAGRAVTALTASPAVAKTSPPRSTVLRGRRASCDDPGRCGVRRVEVDAAAVVSIEFDE